MKIMRLFQTNKFLKIFIVVLLIILMTGGYFFYKNNFNREKELISDSPTPTVSNTVDSNAPYISEADISRGWYWGDKNQKKPGTPDNWIYTEAGRSSSWHKVGVDSSFSPEPDSAYCGGWDSSGEIVCSCKGKLTKPTCPQGVVCDSGDYFCQGICGSCCYKGVFDNPAYPKCR